MVSFSVCFPSPPGNVWTASSPHTFGKVRHKKYPQAPGPLCGHEKEKSLAKVLRGDRYGDVPRSE